MKSNNAVLVIIVALGGLFIDYAMLGNLQRMAVGCILITDKGWPEYRDLQGWKVLKLQQAMLL